MRPEPPLLPSAATPEIVIDPEVQALCLPPTVAERDGLRQRLLAEGCPEPLPVWAGRGVLLEERSRYELCREHGVPFVLGPVELAGAAEAHAWAAQRQLARHGLSAAGQSYLRGRLYLAARSQGRRSDLLGWLLRLAGRPATSPQTAEKSPTRNGTSPQTAERSAARPTCAARLAGAFGVSRGTVERDGAFARCVDVLVGTCGELARQLILTRGAPLTRKAVCELALLDPAEQRAALERVRAEGRLRRERGPPETVRLPAEPAALAAALVRKLGRERAGAVRRALAEALAAGD